MINKMQLVRKDSKEKEYVRFVIDFKRQMKQYYSKENYSKIILLCIGTNKIIGDMIGPVVGEYLKNTIYDKDNIVILGNMENTLNFKNAYQEIKQIQEKYDNPFIITIDTALSKNLGTQKICVNTGEIEIGKAVSKGIKYYSHINIKGIVGKYNDTLEENIKTLENVKLQYIFYLSNIISQGIIDVIKNIK